MGAKMSSVKAVDYKSVKVTWQKANAATVGTHTFKQQAGKSYIYKIKYVFPEYSVDSKERSCINFASMIIGVVFTVHRMETSMQQLVILMTNKNSN